MAGGGVFRVPNRSHGLASVPSPWGEPFVETKYSVALAGTAEASRMLHQSRNVRALIDRLVLVRAGAVIARPNLSIRICDALLTGR
jgi:hypothetical protein